MTYVVLAAALSVLAALAAMPTAHCAQPDSHKRVTRSERQLDELRQEIDQRSAVDSADRHALMEAIREQIQPQGQLLTTIREGKSSAETVPLWIQILSALLTPVIGVATIFIARQQWRTAHSKYRLYLFEKRLALYNAQ